ncbi:tyrosinase family protein [Massilia niabensis]|uniref:Tyrosinase family protein n=1 Tax=Massilia niabensis TaxID=544910 RepID=A0ABW0LBE2_9BURK
MKANTNSADPRSWSYWTNIHINRCPHGIAYFLSWHRGYLYHFERQLRLVANDARLVLPYWDYYSYATLPAEFTNASSTNPLYVPRLNTNVRQALTLAPFSNTLTNFQRGLSNAFEPVLESAPHNPVHDIIGNVMATMQSPTDPIFWLHHANVDRLWAAWVNAGAGRQMPARTHLYWSGSHTYNSTLSIQKRVTYDTRSSLYYYYQSEVMPTRLPLADLSRGKVFRVQADGSDPLVPVPPPGPFRVSGRKSTGDATFSIGGALAIGLDQRSVSAQFPIAADDWSAVQEIARGNTGSVRGSAKKFKSVEIVLDKVELADDGKQGGYYYQVYLNLPAADGASNRLKSMQIGTVGAFQISGAMHRDGTAQLRFPVPRRLLHNPALRLGIASISFIRVDGDISPRGPTIGIGEARFELSTEDKDS